ncbi:MAG: type I secretion system permease/ATPase [Comamonadaceae bacterium]|jgi:ATP-binding cassette subfamily C exporter for protease/lipase|uniref:type I secretion system permease/ATPase n=1 Tax=Candidatus Skiveiella danica TaxID=3386177 RepID=UPI001D45C9A3|nr:type I secretion system permease/ATPase [Comamonadaceae bacterium]MBK9197545.1 type I secretion system permease/ATPase [Betaproteobacteria bacterium]
MHTPPFFERSDLTRALWAFRREFFVVGLFSMVANLLMLTPTLYMLQVYDRVMLSGSDLTLIAVSLICLFLLGVMGTAEWFRSRLLVRVGVAIDQELSTRVFNASFEAYLNQTSAHPSRAFSDLIQVRQFLTGQGVFAFFDAPWTPIYIGVLFLLSPWLGALAILFALVQGFIGWFGHRHTLEPSEAAGKAFGDAQAYFQGKLQNLEVVESMGMTHNLRRQWEKKHATYMEQNDNAQALSHRIVAWSKFIRYSQQSLVLGAGALLVIDGQMTVGAMIASNVLMGRALGPIDQIVSTWRTVASVKAAFLRLERLIEEYPERDPALRRVAPTGSVAIREVVATAEGRIAPILKGISARFEPGTVTAILGPSGSGKSTLARVLVGIWPSVQGEVLLDALPMNSWDRTELGPYLGYLPQDIELFDGTLAENIARFGDVDAERVIAAAQCTGLHEMILRFPKGYDTPIGEAGHLLSGGQRQRIALARAVYGEPCLIVLDEPNANLDDAGEQALMQAIRELKAKGKTIVLITHRPNALGVADRIVLLADGRIQAQGPRDEVLASVLKSQPAGRNSPPQSALPATR